MDISHRSFICLGAEFRRSGHRFTRTHLEYSVQFQSLSYGTDVIMMEKCRKGLEGLNYEKLNRRRFSSWAFDPAPRGRLFGKIKTYGILNDLVVVIQNWRIHTRQRGVVEAIPVGGL